MLTKPFGAAVEPLLAPDEPSPQSGQWATPPKSAPISWPTGGMNQVPVSGQLSEHARESLRRMGILK